MKKILYTLAAAAILLTACNKDEGTPEVSDNVPVQFSTAITKASGKTWANGDKIGVFTLTTGGTLPGNIVADGTNNVLYTYNSTKWYGKSIYFPSSGAGLDFVAYYPHRPIPVSEPYIYKVNVATQTTPENIDLLYSNNAIGKSKTTPNVTLNFEHQMSKIELTLVKGDGLSDVEMPTIAIVITGMPTKADFALADGTFSNEGTIGNIIPQTVTTGVQYDAIVIPQKTNTWSGRKLVFTIGSDVYEYAIANTDDFVSGKSHSYNITIKKSGITVSHVDITNWTGIGSSTDLGEGI